MVSIRCWGMPQSPSKGEDPNLSIDGLQIWLLKQYRIARTYNSRNLGHHPFHVKQSGQLNRGPVCGHVWDLLLLQPVFDYNF